LFFEEELLLAKHVPIIDVSEFEKLQYLPKERELMLHNDMSEIGFQVCTRCMMLSIVLCSPILSLLEIDQEYSGPARRKAVYHRTIT